MKDEKANPPVPVPEQVEGGKTDTIHSKEAGDLAAAHTLFLSCKNRLLNINEWGQIAGKLSAEFRLTDEWGQEISGPPQVGNFIRIDIPGPGTNVGDGYDWVEVEELEDKTDPKGEVESVYIQVRPADNPANNKDDVAHFFNAKASSSFTLHRQVFKVTAGVHGRNEVPNTDSESLLDKTRNVAVGAAAIFGFNAPQWKGLVKGVMGE
jgi:hypothetical protein